MTLLFSVRGVQVVAEVDVKTRSYKFTSEIGKNKKLAVTKLRQILEGK